MAESRDRHIVANFTLNSHLKESKHTVDA